MPASLVERFIEMSAISTGDVAADAELRLQCAFSFPAVVLAVGATGWVALAGAFQVLVRDVMWNVRKTLSCSLHEIAKALPQAVVERDLMEVFELFLRDSEEVRIGIVSHLFDFFKVLSKQSRESYLPTLTEVRPGVCASRPPFLPPLTPAQLFETTSPYNWRMRHVIALQLPPIISLFPEKSVFSSIVPLTFTLVNDAVAEVRTQAFSCVPALLTAFKKEKKMTNDIVKRLEEMAKSDTYVSRARARTPPPR